MSHAYGISEEAFHKLQRAQDSIELMSILFSEVQRPTTYTPPNDRLFFRGAW